MQVTRFLILKNKIKGSKENSKCTIFLTKRTFIHETEGKYHLESELDIYIQLFAD